MYILTNSDKSYLSKIGFICDGRFDNNYFREKNNRFEVLVLEDNHMKIDIFEYINGEIEDYDTIHNDGYQTLKQFCK